jgi:hypothetical protein
MSTSPPSISAAFADNRPERAAKQHPRAREKERHDANDCAGYEYGLLQERDRHPGGGCVNDVAPGFRTGRFFSYAALAILMSTLACAGVRYPTLE